MPPDISQVEEVIDAPIGSIYIDEVENVVYVKGEASWEIIIKKIESLNYISSSSIAIIKEGEDNKIQVIAGPGIKVTKLGVSANVDSANLSIDSAGKLTAKSDKALWNAAQLQGEKLDLSGSAKDGDILKYENGKWTNQEEIKYESSDGIQIDADNKIQANIDSASLSIDSAGKLTAKSDEALWNAAQLQGEKLDLSGSAKEGELLKYKDGKWTNAEELKYKSGGGIQIDTKDKIQANIDSASLSIDSAGKLTAKSDNALWNAAQLQGHPINQNWPSRIGTLFLWNGSWWGPQSYDMEAIIQGDSIYLTGLSISNRSSNDRILMREYDGVLQGLDDFFWNIDGNSEILKGNKSIGYNSSSSAYGINIMTKGQTRLRFLSDGSIEMVSRPTEQESSDGTEGFLTIDNYTGAIYQYKSEPWHVDGDAKTMLGDKVIDFTNTLNEDSLDIKVKDRTLMSFKTNGKIYIDVRCLESEVDDDLLSNMPLIGQKHNMLYVRGLRGFSTRAKRNYVKAKTINFKNVPLGEASADKRYVMGGYNGTLYSIKFHLVPQDMLKSFDSEKDAKYIDIKNKQLGALREIGGQDSSYKEFKIPLNLQENSAGEIDLYITSVSNSPGNLYRIAPIKVLLYYDYIANFQPRITDATIVGACANQTSNPILWIVLRII